MRRRVALGLTAVVVAAQLFRQPALMNVVSGQEPAAVSLTYPIAHIVFAPVTVPADWINAGSRAELAGFFAWALAGYLVARLMGVRRSLWRESVYFVAFVLGLLAFSAWLVFLPRSIPRLVAPADSTLIFDAHSHSSASRDGRRGFGAAANAGWHARAGFHAAFLTDHNQYGAARQWRTDRPAGAVRLLDGEELSLRDMHLIVLGNTQRINNEPWNDSWDSTLMLVRQLAAAPERPYLVASLPEYWKHRWGTDIGVMVEAGIEGFEIWTTSPKAMEVPDPVRREVIARATVERLGMFGATDMHGIGHTASVWNVASVPGWHSLGDSALTQRLVDGFRERAGSAHDVVALRRWLPQSKAGSLFAVPLGLLTALRTMSPGHAAALLVWIWLLALTAGPRSPRSSHSPPAPGSGDRTRPSEPASG